MLWNCQVSNALTPQFTSPIFIFHFPSLSRENPRFVNFPNRKYLLPQSLCSTTPSKSLNYSGWDDLKLESESVQSGGVLDITTSTKKSVEETKWPIMIGSQTGHSYFLLSDPESAGSPPRHNPPPVGTNHAKMQNHVVGRGTVISEDDHMVKHTYTTATSSKSVKKISMPSLGFPVIKTGVLGRF